MLLNFVNFLTYIVQEHSRSEGEASASSSFVENEADSDNSSHDDSMSQSQKQESKTDLPRVGGRGHHSLRAISDDDKYAIIQDWLFQGRNLLTQKIFPTSPRVS